MLLPPLRTLSVVAALVAPSPALSAEVAVPSPVTIVVPFTPGGGPDAVARLIAPRIATQLGAEVRVVNRPGEQSMLGTAEVAAAAPDGRTLLLASPASIAILPAMFPGALGYDPERDLVPVALVVGAQLVLALHPSVPARNLDELIRYARANPNQLQIGTTGPGTVPEFAATLFERMAGIRLRHVPFPGSAEMVDDLVKGKLQIAIDVSVVSAVQAGQLRAIAVTGQGRLAALPDVPTVSEAGLPGYEASGWYGLFAPRGVAPEILTRLAGDVGRVLVQPDLVRTLSSRGFQPRGGSPEQMQNFLRTETTRWTRVAREVLAPAR